MIFSRKVYGYDPDEVDKYLSRIVTDYEAELDKKKDRLEELVEENRTMKAQLEIFSKQVEKYRQHEETVGSAIIIAEETARRTLEEAEIKRKEELEKITGEARRWEERSEEVRRELTEFEEEIASMLEKYQSEVSYLASKEIKKKYFGGNAEKGKTA